MIEVYGLIDHGTQANNVAILSLMADMLAHKADEEEDY
jgi:hypothetical protein